MVHSRIGVRHVTLAFGLILAACGVTRADWSPGDPYKMHYPQLPDVNNGWDVNMISPKVLADDWLCTESGAVSDLHFWYSWRDADDAAFLDLGGILHVSIHSDIPATPTSYSRPGDLLWQRDLAFGAIAPPQSATIVNNLLWGTGTRGYYDPNTGLVEPDGPRFIGQFNITEIQDAFVQEQGTIYWLDLSMDFGPGLPPFTPNIGWTTSGSPHFNDDAVWGDFPYPPTAWNELRDPIDHQSLDLAFVITPEPGSATLLAIGAIGLLARRRAA